jgi:hypothetical protein
MEELEKEALTQDLGDELEEDYVGASSTPYCPPASLDY